MALAWATVENALHAWVVSASGLAAGKVLWAFQNIGQRERPYVTLRILGLERVGHDALVQSYDADAAAGQEVTLAVDGRRTLVVSVQAYSAGVVGAGTAREIVAKVQTALSLPSVQTTLRAAGLAVLNEGRITDVPELVETRWESRASLDVRFHCIDSASEKTGYIASVQIEEDP
jgi:hypothetical protein